MREKEVFDSVDAVRARYYPDSARLLKVKSDQLLEFPKKLSKDSLETIERITSGTPPAEEKGAARRHETRTKGGAAKPEKADRRDVLPTRDGKGWDVVTRGKRLSHHATQARAENAAKRELSKASGGVVMTHGKDGRIRNRNRIRPA